MDPKKRFRANGPTHPTVAMRRTFSPFFLLGRYPGALPQAGMRRAFGALLYPGRVNMASVPGKFKKRSKYITAL